MIIEFVRTSALTYHPKKMHQSILKVLIFMQHFNDNRLKITYVNSIFKNKSSTEFSLFRQFSSKNKQHILIQHEPMISESN